MKKNASYAVTKNDCIKIKNVMLMFPRLLSPEAYKGGYPSYSSIILLDKNEHADAIEFLDKKKKELCPSARTLDTKVDGDELVLEGKGEHYANKIRYKVSSPEYAKPTIVGRDGKTKISDDNEVFGGAFANVFVMPKFSKTNSRFTLQVLAVQLTGDGERFGEASKEMEEARESIVFDEIVIDDVDDENIPF